MIAVFASRRARVGVAMLVQSGILAVAVAAPLSARLTGREYLLRVAPVDPIDPFRGAYVALGYPGLTTDAAPREGGPSTVYVPLVREAADGSDGLAGADLWRGGVPAATPPAAGPYLRCRDEVHRLRCGIESWFLPQRDAAAVERALGDGSAVAVVRVDGRGNAALIEVRPRG